MPSVELWTERLHLRPLAESDAEQVVALHADPEVMRFLGRPRTREEALTSDLPRYLRWTADPFGFWWATERDGGAPVGWFLLRPATPEDGPRDVELGYRLHRSHWGRGHATEGSRALVEHAFTELDVDRVWAGTMAVNQGSRRVMEKVGLRYLRTEHQDWADPLPGSEHGEVVYAITRAEWERGHRPPGAGPEPAAATPR